MKEKNRKIFIEGIQVDSIKDDKNLVTFFDEFDDTIFRVADKKFAALCKKYKKKAEITILVKFEEE
jgi:hypothetical protein